MRRTEICQLNVRGVQTAFSHFVDFISFQLFRLSHFVSCVSICLQIQVTSQNSLSILSIESLFRKCFFGDVFFHSTRVLESDSSDDIDHEGREYSRSVMLNLKGIRTKNARA